MSKTRPAHYKTDKGFEAIDVIEDWGCGFCVGSAIKWKMGIELRFARHGRRGFRGLLRYMTTRSGWRIRNVLGLDPTRIDLLNQRRVDRFGPFLVITHEELFV